MTPPTLTITLTRTATVPAGPMCKDCDEHTIFGFCHFYSESLDNDGTGWQKCAPCLAACAAAEQGEGQ